MSSAQQRARWMAELADALDRAQRLSWELAQEPRLSAEALELYGRIETARGDLESLRIGRLPQARFDETDLSDDSPWRRPRASDS